MPITPTTGAPGRRGTTQRRRSTQTAMTIQIHEQMRYGWDRHMMASSGASRKPTVKETRGRGGGIRFRCAAPGVVALPAVRRLVRQFQEDKVVQQLQKVDLRVGPQVTAAGATSNAGGAAMGDRKGDNRRASCVI